MKPRQLAPLVAFSLGCVFLGLLLWGLSGPSAGAISDPVGTRGTVALVDQEGKGAERRCSIQVSYEVRGKGYGTGQMSYEKNLCRYRLGSEVPVVYSAKRPGRSVALKEIRNSPMWPAYLSGALLVLSLAWLAAIWPRPERREEPAHRKTPAPAESEDSPAPREAKGRTSQPTAKDPAGWYPVRGGRLRWWNGSKWTDNYQ